MWVPGLSAWDTYFKILIRLPNRRNIGSNSFRLPRSEFKYWIGCSNNVLFFGVALQKAWLQKDMWDFLLARNLWGYKAKIIKVTWGETTGHLALISLHAAMCHGVLSNPPNLEGLCLGLISTSILIISRFNDLICPH